MYSMFPKMNVALSFEEVVYSSQYFTKTISMEMKAAKENLWVDGGEVGFIHNGHNVHHELFVIGCFV